MARGKRPADFILIFCVLILTVLGLIMIFSASMYNAGITYNNAFFFFVKQLIYGIVGFFLMFIISRTNYKVIKHFAPYVMIGSILLLGLVLIPGVGTNVNGAQRWIQLPGGTIQPSEFNKIALILFMAYSIEKKGELMRSFRYGFLPYCGLLLIMCGLIALEPNLSTAAITGAILIGMLFIGGVNLKYIGVIVAGVFCAGIAMIVITPWRVARMLAYTDPWSNIQGSGWQIAQSLMALGSGGIFGQGLGNGKAKLMFMPEPQNDFIFAHIGEELGLVGGILILFVYLLLIWRLVKISMEAPDTFATLFCGGMAGLLGMQVFINVGVVTNIIPVTGMPLPFVSAGASSLISLLCGMGVVLNISKYCNL